jgi:hypothetical protein
MYSPATGRWLSADTSMNDGLNRYAYVRNSPLRFSDPTGHKAEPGEQKAQQPAQPSVVIIVPSTGETAKGFFDYANEVNRKVYHGRAQIVLAGVEGVKALPKNHPLQFLAPPGTTLGEWQHARLFTLSGKEFSFKDAKNLDTVLVISHSGWDGPTMSLGISDSLPDGYHGIVPFLSQTWQPWTNQGVDFWNSVGDALKPSGKIILEGCNQGADREGESRSSYADFVSKVSDRPVFAVTQKTYMVDIIGEVTRAEAGQAVPPIKRFQWGQ